MVLAALADLVCPRSCAGCGASGHALCASCAGALHGAAALCRPTPAPAGLPLVAAAAAYDGAVRALLIAHKERGALALTAPLGRALARAVAKVAPESARPLVLVPAPSARSARRQRGYDHARRLAQAAAGALDAEVVPALRVVRRTADQSRLSATDRAENLAGAFTVRAEVNARLRDGQVVVVDDLMTTGATLAEAARALRRADVVDLAAAVVAATSRR